MAEPWSILEVELIVADYFSMLFDELVGNIINKTEHRKNLITLLDNRSEGSIEFKHQNISAILINLGQPYIRGYLPRSNYQQILEKKVVEFLRRDTTIEIKFQKFIEKDIFIPIDSVNFENTIVPPPVGENLKEPRLPYKRKPIKVNYLEREQRNRKLGLYGEEFVFNYEKWNLNRLGKSGLAEKIEWISKDEGDGAGFDILSKNLNGTDKYIEVKTTRLGKETPFFFSSNELQFSVEKSANYQLFRLFNVDSDLKMFIKNGALDQICSSIPIMYKGFF